MQRRSIAERNALVMQWRYLPLRFARLLPLSEDDRDDAIQVGFIALICAADNWDASAGTLFQTYAFIAIRNRLRTWMDKREQERRRWRKARAIIRRRLRDGLRKTPESEGATDGEMSRALAGLSPAERRLLDCRYRLGKTLRNIAAELGISHETARTRLDDVVGKLFRALHGKNGGKSLANPLS